MAEIVLVKEGRWEAMAEVPKVPGVGEVFRVDRVYVDPPFVDLTGQRLTAIARLDDRLVEGADEKMDIYQKMLECFAIGQEPEDVISQVGGKLGLSWELVSGGGRSTRRFGFFLEEEISVTVAIDDLSSWLLLSVRRPSINPWQKDAYCQVERMVEIWLDKLGKAFALALGIPPSRRFEKQPFIFLEWEKVPQIRI